MTIYSPPAASLLPTRAPGRNFIHNPVTFVTFVRKLR